MFDTDIVSLPSGIVDINLTTKTVDSREPIVGASIRILEGSGSRGSKLRQFNEEVAVRKFESWLYVACMINAKSVASTPLRLYSRKSNVRRKAFNSNKVRARQKRYMLGDRGTARPSRYVCNKVAEWGDDSFEVVNDKHPILDLLSSVNPWMNGFEMTVLRFVYLQLCGNAYTVVVSDSSKMPTELWLLPSQRTRVIPGTHSGTDLIRGYVYGWDTATQTTFEDGDVLHNKLPNPADPFFYGRGYVEAAWTALSLHQAKRENDTAFFDNYARPDWLLITKAGTSQPELDRFERNVEQKLGGTRKHGRVLTITGDVTAQALNLPPADLGDDEKIVEEIAAVTGVPVAKIKANHGVAGGQASVSEVAYQRDTVLPLLKMDEELLNARLIPMYGDDAEDEMFLAYDNPIPADDLTDETIIRNRVLAGAETINGWRAEDNLEPIDGGDVARFNGVPLDQMGQQAPANPNNITTNVNMSGQQGADGKPIVPVAPTEQGPQWMQPQQTTAILTVLEGVTAGQVGDTAATVLIASLGVDTVQAEAMVKEAKTKKPPEPPSTVVAPATKPPQKQITVTKTKRFSKQSLELKAAKIDGVTNAMTAPSVTKFAAALTDIFKRQSVACANFAQHHVSRKKKGLSDGESKELARKLAGFNDDLNTAITDVLEAAVSAGGEQGIKALTEALGDTEPNIAGPFDVTNPEVAKWVKNYTIKLAGDLSKTTVESVAQAISDGLDAGERGGQLADRIRDLDSTTFSTARAELIGRTESVRGYVEGEVESWRQSGQVAGKRWLLGPEACDFCVQAAEEYGEKGVGLDEAFYDLGDSIKTADGDEMDVDYADVDGPPLHPQCRCDLIPVLKDEE